MIVLDASAVLAFFLAEPGAEVVMGELETGTMISTVNLTEVIARLSDRGTPIEGTLTFLRRLGSTIVSFDEELAVAAGELRRPTRPIGLSLGDRACLALAAARGLPVLTADRNWAALDVGVEVRLIR